MCVLSATDEELTPLPLLSLLLLPPCSIHTTVHASKCQAWRMRRHPAKWATTRTVLILLCLATRVMTPRRYGVCSLVLCLGCFSVASATAKTLTLCVHVQSRTIRGCMTLAMVTTGRVVFLNTAHEGTSAARNHCPTTATATACCCCHRPCICQ